MANGNATDQPWEGGLCVPVLPPHVPLFDSAAIVVAQQSDAQAGVAVSYGRGIFTRQAWSTGHPVPGVIEVLKPQEVGQIRDQVREQLDRRGVGLTAKGDDERPSPLRGRSLCQSPRQRTTAGQDAERTALRTHSGRAAGTARGSIWRG